MNGTGTTSYQCGLSADASIGPIANGCRDDFTFTFEQYFLSTIPSIVFLLLAPIRVNTLRKRTVKVSGKFLLSLKLISISSFAALQLTTVVLWATTKLDQIRTPAAIASSLSFISSLVLLALSYLEHSKSLRPSALLNGYLFITVLFDIAVLRTLWLALPSATIRGLFTTSFALKATILFLEAKEKRNYLHGVDRPSPEETSGLYSQSFVWWLNAIIKRGYQHVLKPMDLYPIDNSMSSEVLNRQFWQAWNNAALTAQPSLIKVTITLLQWPIIIPIFPRLALLGFTFCQPLLVSRLLLYLQSRNESAAVGYGLIGAYSIVYFGISVSNALFMHRLYRFLTILRGVLVTAMYSKTIEISTTAVDNNAAVTLMSTDVERLILGLRGMHDLWANVLQFGLAAWLLQTRVGWASIGPFVVIFVAILVTGFLAGPANKFQLDWIQKIEKRVGITSNMLGHMKGIKMLGLTKKLTEYVQHLRIHELRYAQRFRTISAVTAGLAFAPNALGPVATFAFYAVIAAKDGSTVDAPRLFTSLSLLILITQPLFAFFEDIVSFRTTFGCAERIEKFLVAQTRSDNRFAPSVTTSQIPAVVNAPNVMTGLPVGSDNIELEELPASDHTNDMNREIVRIEDGSFSWDVNTEPTIHDINCKFYRSELTLIIGPVASGKTTLLKAMLGEIPSSEGLVSVSESEIAYCDQTPWLINASVKNNIIGFSNFDRNHYDTVVFSCDLEQDIATFPNGHDTVIGSKGITLSTGQKQRVAIARAVYARKNFVIFDDVFSGLDANTQRNVFTRLLGSEGLLRQWNSTVVIATHAVNLLPLSDRIIALSPDGTIAEQGTFDELNAREGYVQRFCLEHADGARTATQNSMPNHNTEHDALAQTQSVTLPVASEDKSRQLGDRTVYSYYFRTIGMTATATCFALACGWAFFNSFPTVWLKWYSDANANEPNKHTGYYLGVYAALQTLMLINICALAWFCFNVMAKRSGLKLHETLLRTVMSAPMSFFSKTDTGSITTRFSQDMNLLDSQLPISVMVVSGTFLGSISQIGLIASGAYYVSIAFPFLFAIYFIVQRYYLRTSRQMRFLDLEEKEPVYTQFLESLAGLSTLRAFAWQKQLIAQNHVLIDRSQKPFYLMYMIQTWLSLVLDLITCALAVIVVAVSIKMRDTVSVGFTGVSLTQIISFTSNLRLAIMFWTQMETSIGAVARVKKFEEETENENRLGAANEPPADWPNRGCVEVNNLTVSYGSDEASRKALDNITFTIPAGQKLAVVGRTGSGKSTLLASLFCLLDPTEGHILIDKVDISTISRERVRSGLNAISEDQLFLHGSIRLNLDPYQSSTDAQLRNSLEKVRLWDAIHAKGGLDADWNDDILSHGQKQIFCLARALLHPSKVVVLDEISSAVDRETDDLIQKVVREELEGKTVICIAHRVSTVMDFDRVVVLSDGKIVEYGDPRELMKLESGNFRGLAEKGL